MIVFRWFKKAKLIASPVFFSQKSFWGTFATFLTIFFTVANFTKIDPLKISKINILAGRFSLGFFLFFLDHIKGKLSLWLMV